MPQYKTGLHKEVSEIFNGVSPPKDGGNPALEQQDYTAPKPSAPSHMTPTKPKSEQPPTPEETLDKQPNAAVKIIEKILGQKKVEQLKNKLIAPEGVSNKRQKVMMIVVPVLFIVLIFMFIRVFGIPSRKNAKPRTSAPSETTAVTDSDSEIIWKIPQPYPTTLRDPMQFGLATSQTGGLIVRGIVYSEDMPAAIIGNHIVHEGDKILDVTIIKINENSVEFEANNKKWMQKVER